MASGGEYIITLQQAGMAASKEGSPALPGIGSMPEEVQAGMKNITRELQNRVPPLTGFFKQMGIEVSLKSMLKQSQIFTSYVGTIFQLFGALVDVMLAPLLPILVPALRWIGSKIPIVSEWMQKKVADLVEAVTPIWNWLRDTFAGGWESGFDKIGVKMGDWMESHGVGFARGLVEGVTGWIGDHPGWAAVGAAIALVIGRKLTISLAPLLVGLAWGGAKWAAAPAGIGGANPAGAVKNRPVWTAGRTTTQFNIDAPETAANRSRFGNWRSMLGRGKEAVNAGWRSIAGKRVNLFTNQGMKALATLSKAGQLFAIFGGAYTVGKEWAVDRGRREEMVAELRAAGMDEGLPSAEAISWMRTAEGATMFLGGKFKNPTALFVLAAAQAMLAGGGSIAQDILNRKYQQMTPDDIVDPSFGQNWFYDMNKLLTKYGVSSVPTETDQGWLAGYAGSGGAMPGDAGGFFPFYPNLSGQPLTHRAWGGPGSGSAEPGFIQFSVQFKNENGVDPSPFVHYQMDFDTSFKHYQTLMEEGHTVVIDTSNIGAWK